MENQIFFHYVVFPLELQDVSKIQSKQVHKNLLQTDRQTDKQKMESSSKLHTKNPPNNFKGDPDPNL